MEKKQMYTAVAAVVVVIIVVAAVAWYMTGNNGGSDETGDGDTYYFYFDGVEEAAGWQHATGENAQVAYQKVLENVGLEYEFNQYGMLKVDGYEETYDSETSTGIGFGFYLYTSTDTSMPSATYFALGPVLADVTGNIVYVTYSNYEMNPVTYVNTYSSSPADSSEWMTSGPFAVGSDYEPLQYPDTYSFYLDNIVENEGWYTVTAEDAESALSQVFQDLGLNCEFDQYGMLTVDGFEAGFDAETNTGTGFGVYIYTSDDTSMPMPSYFAAGPVVGNATGNVFYISFGSYTMNPVTYATSYAENPSSNQGWLTSGPFEA